VITPGELHLGHRPLETARFAGAVDNVGGKTLSQVLAHVDLYGNVAAIGMAEGGEFHSTVMPFILRGVSLLGTSSNNTPMPLRTKLWNLLGGTWKPKELEAIVTRTVELKDLMQAFDDLMHRKVHGRILVEIRK
jgi:NADPH2:quinone reductase